MKRVTMINELAQILHGEDPSSPSLKESTRIVDILLTHMQSRGMRAPYSKKKDLGCECGCKGRCEIGSEWEDSR